jgi:transcriptional regulator with XRE-family HTH domain
MPTLNKEQIKSLENKFTGILGDYNKLCREVGSRFRSFRSAIGKTPEQIAEECGFTVDYISGVEQGDYIPIISFIEYFYRKYRLDLTWLVKGEGKMFLSPLPLK